MTDEQSPKGNPQAIQTQSKPKAETTASEGTPEPTSPIVPEYVEAEKALQKLEKPEVLSLAAFFSSKMTLGPDPESAKLMAQTEMHHETCRLEGYKENLKHQDLDGQRKHQFRLKKLNHETFLLTSVLLGALAGAGVGLYLTILGNPVGSNILIASIATVVYVISGKTPFHRKEE
jgi:hypothetical protein